MLLRLDVHSFDGLIKRRLHGFLTGWSFVMCGPSITGSIYHLRTLVHCYGGKAGDKLGTWKHRPSSMLPFLLLSVMSEKVSMLNSAWKCTFSCFLQTCDLLVDTSHALPCKKFDDVHSCFDTINTNMWLQTDG